MEDCLFCKIVAGEIPSTKIYEDEFVYAFADIDPQAPFHAIIVPKEHICCANKITAEVVQAAKPKSPSIGSQLSYGKWYYGVDPKAKPVVKRFTGGIEKRYPCKDGGELVVTYVTRADKSSV